MQAPAEGATEQVMEAEPSEQKRKRSAAVEFDPEVDTTEKTPGKVSEKKRRRSHTAEGSESDVPSKIRKTSEGGEKGEDETEMSKCSQYLILRNPQIREMKTLLCFSETMSLLFLC